METSPFEVIIMSRFRPNLPARLRGKRFDAEGEVDEIGQFGGIAISTNDELLRMAAIAAVLSIIESGGDQVGEIGRQSGPVWSYDHRQMANGRSGVLAMRSGRSTWR
jgi:hypothetical protein